MDRNLIVKKQIKYEAQIINDLSIGNINIKQFDKLLYELMRLSKTNYFNDVIGYYVAKSGYTRFYTQEKTFNDFNLDDETFIDEIIKPRKKELNSDGYMVYKCRETYINDHDYVASKTYYKISNYGIIYRLSLYYNGLNKKGNPRYSLRWSLNCNTVVVHHLDGNKTNNKEGNIERLTQELHDLTHDLQKLVSIGNIKQSYARKLFYDAKHKDISIYDARVKLGEKLKGI